MALDTKLVGSSTGNGLEVNASNQAKVVLETDALTNPGNVGGARLFSENDRGTVSGTAFLYSPETSDDFRLRTGVDQSLFNLSFEGTNIARDRIQQNDSTTTAAQPGGFLTLNSGNNLTTGQGTNIRTYRTFPMFGSYPLYTEFWLSESSPTATGAISEYGLGYCSGVTAQLTDGVYFRRLSGGQLRLVVTYNSTDVLVSDITTTNIPDRDGSGVYDATQINHYVIVCHNDVVRAWINDTLVATIDCASTIPSPTSASAQPLFARQYNSGTASAARKINIGFVNVSTGDQATNKPYTHMLCGMGGGAYQIQPGTASGPTLTRGAALTGWPTSTTAQTAGTYTATTAPATNSLGGIFITAAVSTLTDNADYPIFSYLNPAGTSTLPGKTLYITSVRLSELIVFAAAATNTSLMRFAVGIGSTSSATTATEGAAIVAARLVPIGQVFWATTAAVGDTKGGWTLDFEDSPLVCPPGTYVQLIMRHTGTVTTNTLQVTGMATFIGYHE